MSKSLPGGELSKEFLKVAWEQGGGAKTTDIRKKTGMDRSKVNYRFKVLEEEGYIEITKAEKGHGDRTPPRVAKLTEKGKEFVEEYVAEEEEQTDVAEDEIVVKKETIEQMKDRIQKLENRERVIDSNSFSPDFDVDEFYEDVRDVMDMIEDFEGSQAVSEEDIPEIDEMKERVSELEEYVVEWMETAQNHFDALREVVEMELDVNLEDYIDNTSNAEGPSSDPSEHVKEEPPDTTVEENDNTNERIR